MTDSYKQFDQWCERFGFDPTRLTRYEFFALWQAGRASMRDEVIDKLGDYNANKCAQIAAGIEL